MRTGMKGETMKCPHLVKWVISSCKALESPYTPSLFELDEYCTKKDHRKCPFYLREILNTADMAESNVIT
jgi:hypothetical protein